MRKYFGGGIMSFHSLNSIKLMEIIEINTGSRLGYIKDLKIDCSTCKVLSLILPCDKLNILKKARFIEIPWDNVKKIGIDVILVDYDLSKFNNE